MAPFQVIGFLKKKRKFLMILPTCFCFLVLSAGTIESGDKCITIVSAYIGTGYNGYNGTPFISWKLEFTRNQNQMAIYVVKSLRLYRHKLRLYWHILLAQVRRYKRRLLYLNLSHKLYMSQAQFTFLIL